MSPKRSEAILDYIHEVVPQNHNLQGHTNGERTIVSTRAVIPILLEVGSELNTPYGNLERTIHCARSHF